MSVWNTVSESSEIRKYYENYGVLELKIAHAAWIEEEINRILNYNIVDPSMHQEITDNFFLYLEQQSNEQMKTILYKFDKTRLYEIFSKGYQEELKEAVVIANFTIELSSRLQDLRTDFNNFSQQINSLIIDQTFFSNYFGNLIVQLKNIADALTNGKLRELEKLQTLRDSAYRIKHYINDLQSLFLELMTMCDMLDDSPALNNPQIVDQSHVENFKRDIFFTRRQLLASSFIFEKQPPQIIQTKATNFTFSASVRWVLGNRYPGVITDNKAECLFLSEQQAKLFYINPNIQLLNEIRNSPSGRIAKNISSYSCISENIFSAEFRNMQLDRRPDSDARGVVDQKYTLLVLSTMNVNGLQIFEWTMSLPLVVTVHTTQDAQALSTIIWDNSFSSLNRLPFEVPEFVSWNQLSATVNQMFAAFTKRSLTPMNLDFLYEKWLLHKFPDTEITRHHLCKLRLPETEFTFWKWLYSIMKLASSSYLLQHWIAGNIIGFISKDKVKEILMEQPNGTFLIRFTERSLGAITVNCKINDEILMLEKCESNDMAVMNLDRRIRDFSYKGAQLKWLYNCDQKLIDVAEAFKSSERKLHSGYESIVISIKL